MKKTPYLTLTTLTALTFFCLSTAVAAECPTPKPFQGLDSGAAAVKSNDFNAIMQMTTSLPQTTTNKPTTDKPTTGSAAPETEATAQAIMPQTAAQPPQRPQLINFWATWCPPCRDELPLLAHLAETTDADIHLVNIDDTVEDATRTLKQLNVQTLPSTYAGAELLDQLNIPGLPATFVFHRDHAFLGVGILRNEAVIKAWLDCLR